jgi:HPt (histidine-containing phosphotransfer) domain-containing protein
MRTDLRPVARAWMPTMYDFTERLRNDAETLTKCREKLGCASSSSDALNELRVCAHKLAGAAGVFGYAAVSAAAAALEQAVESRVEAGAQDEIATRLDALLACIEQACLPADECAM